MPRGGIARPLTSVTIMVAALLSASAMPVLADRSSEEPPSSESPVKLQEPSGDGGVVGGVTRRGSVRQAKQATSVAIVDDQFRPTQLRVTVGTTVVWTNLGQHPHTVTADDRAFDSGTLEGGQTFSVTFDEVGPVPYYCQIHGEPGSGMAGVVIVQAVSEEEEEDHGSPASGSDGLARTGLDPIPLGIAALGLAIVGLAALRFERRWRKEVMGTGQPGSAFTEERSK